MTDTVYRAAVQFTKFFPKGWGSPQLYEKLFDLQSRTAIDNDLFLEKVYEPAKNTEVRISSRSKDNGFHVLDGEFTSPFSKMFPGALPPESEKATFQMILPTKWMRKKPIVVHYAGTGDHFFWRRRMFMASPLAKENGIGSIILENPFYGLRKPKDQVRSGLNHVIDIFLMGGALMAETITLLSWCERQGLGPFGLSGISMGGHMTTVCATACNSPVAVIPCLSWSTAGPVFTRGVMSKSVAWDVLEDQLNKVPEYETILQKYCKSFLNLHPFSDTSLSTENIENTAFESSHGSSPQEPNFAMSNNSEDSNTNRNQFRSEESAHNLVYGNTKEYGLGKYKFNVLTLDNNVFSGIEATYNTVLNYMQDKVNVDLFREKMAFLDRDTKLCQPKTKYYMDAFMDCATHLRHFRKPNSKSKIVYVIASHDQYVPRDNEMSPCQIWPNVSIRYIDSGHVMGVVRYQQVFRDAIHDALNDLMDDDKRSIE